MGREARELPNPFVCRDGRTVQTPADCQRRRAEIRDLIVGTEYGGLPPAPSSLRIERLHTTNVKALGGARYTQYRV